MTTPVAHEAVESITGLEALDAPAQAIAKAVRGNIPPGPVKDALSGTWLGHALHPLLTDLPIGTWTSAVLLDWLGGDGSHDAADRLIGLGLAFALPAAATGWTEWADSEPAQRLRAPHRLRPRGRQRRRRRAVRRLAGRAPARLARGGQAARARGRRRAGRGRAPRRPPGVREGGRRRPDGVRGRRRRTGRPVLRDSELPEGESRYAEVEGVGVLVARHGGEVYALSNRCVHRGGPLDEGELSGGCVTCPLHGSTFRLRTAPSCAARPPTRSRPGRSACATA